MISKLLVANRGEIAIRVIQAAREMGIRTVAVFSEADRSAIHPWRADEAYCLGAPEPASSYLNIDRILEIAEESGCDAIHPGYGFLSERSGFSRRCREAGIQFVGPGPEAMEQLGDKISAKSLAVENGVPIAPGFFVPGASAETLFEEAKKIGFPVMLKASAGGGGRGMRAIWEPDDFLSQCRIASDEALKAFGDGTMMVEKLIQQPRHVEVQILGDSHDQVVALFERECSIQRRHQKLIEEAPSPCMGQHFELWEKMRDAAIKICKAAGYIGAGTVEFMVDDVTGEFYFLEVNARIQVEHPVTECVTALDLVQLQLRIAAGMKIELEPGLMQGHRSALGGHAIEARIVAEDPSNNFQPSIGKILAWVEPKMPGVRIDSGYATGHEVPRYYDGMLAKVIAHGENREAARRRLIVALQNLHILGVHTTIPFLIDVLSHPDFIAGKLDTGFIGRTFESWSGSSEIPDELGALAASAGTEGISSTRAKASQSPSVWLASDSFSNSR